MYSDFHARNAAPNARVSGDEASLSVYFSCS